MSVLVLVKAPGRMKVNQGVLNSIDTADIAPGGFF
jgi:hypothetical protein